MPDAFPKIMSIKDNSGCGDGRDRRGAHPHRTGHGPGRTAPLRVPQRFLLPELQDVGQLRQGLGVGASRGHVSHQLGLHEGTRAWAVVQPGIEGQSVATCPDHNRKALAQGWEIKIY